MLDTYKVDEILDSMKIDPLTLVGQLVEWHGQVGRIVRVPSPTGRRRIGIMVPLRLTCPLHCGKVAFVTTVSGLHNGAFCYVFDDKGHYVTNLRDAEPVCVEHQYARAA